MGNKMYRRGELFALFLGFLLLGCGTGPAKFDDDMPTVITDVERVRGEFSPPEDDLLTAELVEEFVELRERARVLVLKKKDGEKYLNPRYVGKNKRRINKRKQLVRMGVERAQLEQGMVCEKYNWIDKKIKQALIARDTPNPSVLDKGMASYRILEPFLKRYQQAVAGTE